MIREILFRGKRIDNGEWVEGTGINTQYDTHGRKHIYIGVWHFSEKEPLMKTIDWYEVIPETVGQYTGLTDKNGKKIFEGDILKMERDIQCSEKTKKREITVGVVWFDTKSAEFGYKSAGHYRCLTLKRWTGDTQEVIGNIHDNPELLEVHNGTENADSM